MMKTEIRRPKAEGKWLLALGCLAAFWLNAQPLPVDAPSIIKTRKPLQVVWQQSPSPGIVSNTVYSGPGIGVWTNALSLAAATNATLPWPTNGPAFFAVTAVDGTGAESLLSNVLEVNAPATNVLTVALLCATNAAGPWTTWTNGLPLLLTNPPGQQFFQLTITRSHL